jgi:hypothetical protein
VTASGSWANASKTTTLTFRATIGSTTVDKVFTLTKANAGAAGTAGTDGTRGTVVGQGQAYGISDSSWSNGHANRVVSNIINGASLTTTLASTALNKIGDTVTLSNGTTYAETRIWSGTAWATVGVVVVGNLFVNGTISGSQINSTGMDSGPSHEFQVDNTTGQVTSTKFFGYNANFGNTFDPTKPTAKFTAYSGGSANCVEIKTPYSAGATSGLALLAESNGTASTAHAFRGLWNKQGSSSNPGRGVNNAAYSSGLVGVANGNAFYAEAGTVGPFTGSHEVAVKPRMTFTPGDIAIDDECLLRNGLSNTFFSVKRSSRPFEVGAIGAITYKVGRLNRQALLAASPGELTVDKRGMVSGPPEFEAIKNRFHLAQVNSLGEGQINVVGEGGNIALGDFIMASSAPGKGMRQPSARLTFEDGIERVVQVFCNFTVAKAREDVSFESPDEVKTIACTYHCG